MEKIDLTAFYAWLPEKEKKAHDLARLMLESSYVPTSTHAYKRFTEATKKAASK